jgi:hypothetical protein
MTMTIEGRTNMNGISTSSSSSPQLRELSLYTPLYGITFKLSSHLKEILNFKLKTKIFRHSTTTATVLVDRRCVKCQMDMFHLSPLLLSTSQSEAAGCNQHDSCSTCGKTTSLMKCKRCKSVAYCSAEYATRLERTQADMPAHGIRGRSM